MPEMSLREYLGDLDRLIQMHAADEVILHSRHILSFYPKIVSAYRFLGRALIMNGRWDEAEAAFRRVLGVLPDDFHAHVGLSEIYDYKRRGDEAIWHLERALETQPTQRDLIDTMRALYKRYRNIDNAKIPLTAGAVARQALNNRSYEQAIETLRTATQKYKDRGDLRVLLADALWKGGDPVEAAEVALDVLTMLPDCLVANRILTELWLQEDRPSDAQRYLNRVEAVEPYLAVELATGAAVADDAFRIQPLDVKRTAQSETTLNRPDWLQDINTDGASSSPADDFAQWTATESTLLGKVAPKPQEPAQPEPPPEPAFDEASFRIDTNSLVEPAQAADIPDWMMASAPDFAHTAADAPAADEADELPDAMAWLNAQTTLEPEQSMPDTPNPDNWLSEYEADILTEKQAEEDQTSLTEIPDWMNAPDELPARRGTGAIAQPEDPLPALDWLSGNDQLLDEALGLESLTASEPASMADPDWMSAPAPDDPITSLIPTDPSPTQPGKPGSLADYAAPRATFGFDTGELRQFEQAQEPADDDNWLDQVSNETPGVPGPMRGLTSMLQEGNFDWMSQSRAPASGEQAGDSLDDDWLGQFDTGAKTSATDSPEWLAALSDEEEPASPPAPPAASASVMDDLDFPELDAIVSGSSAADLPSINDELSWDMAGTADADNEPASGADWLGELGAPAAQQVPDAIVLDDASLDALFGGTEPEAQDEAAEAPAPMGIDLSAVRASESPVTGDQPAEENDLEAMFASLETGDAQDSVAQGADHDSLAMNDEDLAAMFTDFEGDQPAASLDMPEWASDAPTSLGIDVSALHAQDVAPGEPSFESRTPAPLVTHDLSSDVPAYDWMQEDDEAPEDEPALRMPGTTDLESSAHDTPLDPVTAEISLDWMGSEPAEAESAVEEPWDITSLGVLDDSLTGELVTDAQVVDGGESPESDVDFAAMLAAAEPVIDDQAVVIEEAEGEADPWFALDEAEAFDTPVLESAAEVVAEAAVPAADADVMSEAAAEDVETPVDTRVTAEDMAALDHADELDWLADIQTEVQAASIDAPAETEAPAQPALDDDLEALFVELEQHVAEAGADFAHGDGVTTGELRDLFGEDSVPSSQASEIEALFAEHEDAADALAAEAEEVQAEEVSAMLTAEDDGFGAAEGVTTGELRDLFGEDSVPSSQASEIEALFAGHEDAADALPASAADDPEAELAALLAAEDDGYPMHDDGKVAQSGGNQLDSLNTGMDTDTSELDALDAAFARTEDAVSWWNTSTDDESAEPQETQDGQPVESAPEGEPAEAQVPGFEQEASPFDAAEDSDLLAAVRDPAPLDTTAIESLAVIESLPVPGQTSAVEVMFTDEQSQPIDNVDLDALFGEPEVLSDEEPPLVPAQSQLYTGEADAALDETETEEAEAADEPAAPADAVAQVDSPETAAAADDDILPFGESVADITLPDADDDGRLDILDGGLSLESISGDDIQYLEPDDSPAELSAVAAELSADEMQDDDDWLDIEDDPLPDTPPVYEDPLAADEFDNVAHDPFSTGAVDSVDGQQDESSPQTDDVPAEQAAPNIPDWLNAMVPGLDVDYEAEEDAPLEQEYLPETPEYTGPEVEPGFRWVEDIISEESQQVPVLASEAAAAASSEPRFKFTRQPAWLKITRKPAWMKRDTAAEPEAPAAADDDSDLPEWLR
jgi:tetratricopeptide (TPR) repeat protein